MMPAQFSRNAAVAIAALGAAITGAALGGCYASSNATPRIAGVIDLNDLDPDAPTVALDAPPSATAIHRSDWPLQAFFVPQDAVVSPPSYSPLRRWTVASARQVGDSPGTMDAVTLDPVDNEQAEGILMPLATLYDLVAIIPRAIITAPNTPTLNPRNSYQRATPRWNDRPPVTGTAAAEEAAERADRILRHEFGDSLLLNEAERNPGQSPVQRERPSGQST